MTAAENPKNTKTDQDSTQYRATTGKLPANQSGSDFDHNSQVSSFRATDMQADQREQLDRIVRAHLADLLRLASRLTGDLDRAEEIVAESMFRAARSWKRFRNESQPRTWLYKIVINTFRDQIQQRQHLSIESIQIAAKESPADGAECNELDRALTAEIAKLPPRQREVLVLLTFENLKPSQVADMLNMTKSNVYTNLHHARATLREKLCQFTQDKTS